MKPYPEYKETGLSWLPKIPKHWEVVRAKQLFKIIDIRSESGDEELLSVSERYGVVKRENVKVTMFMANSYEGYKLCWPNDLVVNSLWAWSYGLGFSQYHGIISTAYSVYRLKDKTRALPRYFDYFVRGKDFHWELRIRSKGLWKSRYQLSDDSFLSAPVILPPMEEQKRIVRYLDLMTAKIDKLIDAKKKQIALLQEKKQAIVNQVVTRGLNPDVQLKDSGIDWLGKIPAHWEVNKVGHMFSSVLGKMLSSSPTSESDTLEDYICAKDVHFSGIDISDLKQMWFSGKEKLLYSVKQGDLLIVEGGAGAGGSFVYREEKKCYIQNSIHLVRSRGKCFSVDFLYYWMYALIGRNYIPYACNKATIPHFTKDKLFETPFPVVPEEEQKVMVVYLEKKFREIDNASSMFEKEISLYQEYKASLISSLISGRICP